MGTGWPGDCSCLQLPVPGHRPAPLGSVELSGDHCLVTESESSDQNSRTSFFFFSIAVFLEKAMAPHSSTLAWKIPWTEEPCRLQSMGSQELDTTERLHFHFSLSCIGEGNGNPLQCSCLENPRDRGAWGAAVYGVTQSRT